ncbi:hypothetical protein [uncultured Gelidibacter sp.]|uniref:hypothetical protein n=1 Tax=uncultured Gelidibacter sp. TaxID=259318 RepID=UPI0026236280|nr:hypothetical protein [uncultured Gelidibacter sp.]
MLLFYVTKNGRLERSIMNLICCALVLFFSVQSSPELFAQNDTPCEGAQRWTRGASWNQNGSINDSNQAPSPNGIIRCGSSAETQSQLVPFNNSVYNSSQFAINVEGSNACIDPSNGQPVNVKNPTNGQPIIWLNFDVRPKAGSFEIQLNDNSGDKVGWALYVSNVHQTGTTLAANGNILSGDCSNLTKVACGVESSSMWNTIPIDGADFIEATNFYLAIWDQNADGNLSINNFKARYGCGDADFETCSLSSGTPEEVCNNDGTFTINVPIEGINGEYIGYDANAKNGGLSNRVCLTNSGEAGSTSGVISLTYDQGVDYNIQIFETTNSNPPTPVIPSAGCDHPDPYPGDPNNGNADSCVATVTGTAPECCVAPTLVTANGSVCAESQSDIDLTTLVTSNGIVSFHETQAEANSKSNPINSTVSPLAPKTYYVRSEVDAYCFVTAIIEISIDPLPTVTVSGGSWCTDAGLVQNIAGSGMPLGGTYSGTGVTDNGDGTFNFDTSMGTQTLTYTYSDGNGCENSATASLEINDLPTVTVSGGSWCTDAGLVQNIAGSGMPLGGTYSGTGVTDNGDGTFNFDTSMGTQTLTYTYSDGNGCENSATASLEINDLPTVTVSGGSWCTDAGLVQNIAGSGMPLGGTYSGTGVTDNGDGTFNFDTSMGTQTLTYTYSDGNGCENSATASLEINDLPTVTVSGGSWCTDAGLVQNIAGSGMPLGGTYSGTGVTDNGDGTFNFDTSMGTQTLTYTYSDGNGCENSATASLEINDLPTVTVSGGSWCTDAGLVQNIAGSGMPLGGTYSGTGVTDNGDGTFNFDTSMGTQTLTYTYSDGNGCENSATASLEINDLPTVTVSGGSWCTDAGLVQNIAGSGMPLGGTYSGTGVTDNGDGTFNFDTSMGTQTLTYTYSDGNGCENSATASLEINDLPTVTVSGGSWCTDAGLVQNIAGSGMPLGGTYSGTGVTDNGDGTFNFDTSMGAQTLTYTYSDGNGCENSATASLEINDLPTVTVSGGSWCTDAGLVQNIAGSGMPLGGTYSGTGVTDNGDGTFNFDTSMGTQTLTYTYSDGNGCENSATASLEINDLPTVTVSGGSWCTDAGLVQNIAGSGMPLGGTYSGTGVTDNGDGTFNFDTSMGTQTLTYTYSDGNGCENSATASLEINDLPTVTVSGGAWCTDAGLVQNIAGSGMPLGGIYSGTGVTDNGDGTFNFDTSMGTQTLTYTYSDGNGCENSATASLEINDLPIVTVSGGSWCTDAGLVQNIPGSGMPLGGTYSGTGVTDNGDGTFNFDTSVGTQTLTYTYSDGNGCENSATASLEINDLPTVTVSGGSWCADAGLVQNIAGSGMPAGGTYSGTGVTDNGDGTFNFDTSMGTQTLTYTYSDGDDCSNSATATLDVNALPTVTVSGGSWCTDAGLVQNIAGSGMPAGGTYSGTGVTDNGDGTFNFDTSMGTQTLTYTYSDGNGCENSATASLEINDLPTVTVSGGSWCTDAGIVQNIAGSGMPAGGTYSGTGVTDNGDGTFNFDTSMGTQTLTYTYSDGDNCSNSAMATLDVNPLPTVTVSGGSWCTDAGLVQNIAGSGMPAGGTYSGTGVTDNGDGTFNFDTSMGTQTLTYTYSDGNGCENSATASLEINDLPTVTVSGGSWCTDAGLVQNIAGSGMPLGGTYSGTGVTDNGDGTFNFDTSMGTQTLTYTYSDGDDCSNSATATLDVNPLPTVTVSGGSWCTDAGLVQNIAGSGMPVGGIYSGTGVTDNGDGTFNFDTSMGTQTLTYTYSDGNGCENSATASLEINDLPIVTVSGGSWCTDAGLVQNIAGSGMPAGGTYSGTGVTDNGDGTFNFDTSMGTQTLTYSYSDGNGCENSATASLEINDLPTVTVSGGSWCTDAGLVQNIAGSGMPLGGTYSGTGVTDNGDGTFNFDTSMGTQTLTYTYSDGNGCENSATAILEINDLPTVTVSGGSWCTDAGLVQNIAGSGMPLGGTYSGTGVTDNGDGTFNFDTSVGTQTLTYTYSDGDNCSNSATATLDVNALPTVTVSGGSWCTDAGLVQNIAGSGMPLGGTYSGTGVTDNGDGTFNFDTSMGTQTLTYTYSDGNGCENSATASLEINDLPTVTVSGGSWCTDAGLVQNIAGSGMPLGGTYSGTGVTDNGDGTFNFDTSMGTQTLTYTYSDGNGCENSATAILEINDLPTVTVSGGSWCTDAGLVQNIAGSGMPLGGTYSGTGVTDNGDGTFNFDTSMGTQTLTYTYSDGDNCSNSATATLDVNALPTVTVSGGSWCTDAGLVQNIPGSGMPLGGTYSGTGVTDNGDGTFNFDTSVGTQTLTYTYSDGNGCENSATASLKINDLPTVTVSGGSWCTDAGLVQNIAGSGMPLGGTYSGTGVTDNGDGTFNFDTSMGTQTLTYSYSDGDNCSNSATARLEVNPLPTVTITPLEPVCIENGLVQIMASPSGGTFSGSAAINPITGLFDPMIAGNGTHTVTYTYNSSNGCEGKATIDISVITCQAEPECDTVFAYNSETSTCFSEISELKNNNRWGWTNEITAPGTYNFTLYGGAAHCDIDKGHNYGNARVVYADNGDVTVYYEMTGGSVLSEAHVYIGCTPVPMVTKGKKTQATVAPGQYNFNPNLGGGVQNYQVGPVNVSGGSFYLIVHGVACSSGVVDGNENGISFNKRASVKCATPSMASVDSNVSLQKSGDILISPNPFVDKVDVSYKYDYDTDVSIEIRDIRGLLIDSYINNSYKKGQKVKVKFDLTKAVKHMLFVQFTTNKGVEIKKVISSDAKR